MGSEKKKGKRLTVDQVNAKVDTLSENVNQILNLLKNDQKEEKEEKIEEENGLTRTYKPPKTSERMKSWDLAKFLEVYAANEGDPHAQKTLRNLWEKETKRRAKGGEVESETEEEEEISPKLAKELAKYKIPTKDKNGNQRTIKQLKSHLNYVKETFKEGSLRNQEGRFSNALEFGEILTGHNAKGLSWYIEVLQETTKDGRTVNINRGRPTTNAIQNRGEQRYAYLLWKANRKNIQHYIQEKGIAIPEEKLVKLPKIHIKTSGKEEEVVKIATSLEDSIYIKSR